MSQMIIVLTLKAFFQYSSRVLKKVFWTFSALLKKNWIFGFQRSYFYWYNARIFAKKCARTPPVFLQICACTRNCLPLTMCFNFQVQNFLQQQEEEALHGETTIINTLSNNFEEYSNPNDQKWMSFLNVV